MNSRAVLAGVWLTVGDRAFPGATWTDAVDVVVGWWVGATLRLLRGKKSDSVRFMDGPFLTEIEVVREGCWHLRCSEAGLEKRLRHEVTVDAVAFARTVLAASESVLALCRERNWRSPDTEILTQISAELKIQLVKQLI